MYLSYFFLLIYLFTYFWLHWVFIAACRLFSSCSEQGLLFVVVFGLLIAVASLVAEHGLQAHGLQQLWHAGSVSCGSQALEDRLSSCGARVQLLRSMWDLPGPGLEPMSPALAGGFSTTEPPGKPYFLNSLFIYLIQQIPIEHQLCSQICTGCYGSLVWLPHPKPSCFKVYIRGFILITAPSYAQLCYVMGETQRKCKHTFISHRREKLLL